MYIASKYGENIREAERYFLLKKLNNNGKYCGKKQILSMWTNSVG
jgi:hypothetical protein